MPTKALKCAISRQHGYVKSTDIAIGTMTEVSTAQQSLKAPAGTSGWFLPSVGQLAYMRTNVNYLNKRLETVKENYPDGYSCKDRIVPFYRYLPYWSSTTVSGEKNTAIHQFITPSEPNVAKKGNRNDQYLPRPILVF